MKKLLLSLALLAALAAPAHAQYYGTDGLLELILGGTPSYNGWRFDDNDFAICDNTDVTALGRFNMVNLSTATTRVFTMKDADYEVAGTNVNNLFSAAQTFNATVTPALQSGTSNRTLETATTLTSGLSAGYSNGIWNLSPTMSDASGGVGAVSFLRVNPSVDNAGDFPYRGVQVVMDVDIDDAFATGATSVSGMDFITRSSGVGAADYSEIRGIIGSAQHNNTAANCQNLSGINMQLSSGTGSGPVATVNGIRFSSITARSPWTTLYQFRGINPSVSGGSIATQYGLHLPNLTAATTNWAIFSQGGQSSHLGNFRFGSNSAPTAVVHVTQATVGNEALRVESTATNDDPNEIMYQNRVATTDATVTTLHTFTIPVSTTYMIEARVLARRTGGAAGTAEDGAGYKIFATIKNVGGAATIIGAVAATATMEDQAGWDATIDVTGATARLRVTGAANNNVTWHGTFLVSTVGS